MSSRLKPKSCEGCPLYEIGEGWVPAELRPSDVLIVGEAPGEHEAKQGRPFVGQSGWLLSRLLRRLGLEREAVSIHNCLSCRPPGNELINQPWAGAALTHCKPNLLETINRVQPKVIVALGGTALQTLTGYTKIQSVRGFPLRGPQGIWVVPTFHPSFLLPGKGRSANAHLHGAAIHDLKRALEIAENGFQREEVPTVLDPSPLEWSTTEVPRLLQMEMLSIDIETPMKSKIQDEQEILEIDSTIVRISFCGENGASVSIPWQAGYLQGIRQLLASQQVKIWWNGYAFDVPVLEQNGYEVNGPQWDGMWAFAMLQSALPRGLQNVASYFAPEIGPWKHLSNAEPALYNAIDAYAAMKNMLGIREALQNQGRWEVFEEHVVQAWVALKQGGKVNGVHIDLEEQRILGEELAKREGELISDAQSMVPTELFPRKRYKKFPLKPHPSEVEFEGKYYIYGTRTFEPVLTLGKTTRCSKCGAEGVTKTAHLKGGKKNPCHGATIEKVEGTIEVYDELLPFNPKSEKQIKAYALHHKHPLKKNYKTGSETTDKKFVERMIKRFGDKHPLYPLVQELSGISKTKGTYVDGFSPDPLGRVFSEYTFAPSTGRLSSRNINMQNISKNSDNPWAKRIRKTIIPPPGHVFLEVDSAAIEAVLVGYFANDPAYMQRALTGIHAFLCTVSLGIDFNPETVKWVKEHEPSLYARKKRTVHGCFTEGHELLTPEGWKKIEDISDEERIATWNPERKISFETPSQWTRKPITEDVIRFESQNFSAETTWDHRWPVLTSSGNVVDYVSETIPKANAFPGVGIKPDGEWVDPRLIRRLVAIEADGYIVGNKVRFHVKKPRKVAALLELGARYVEETSKGTHRLIFDDASKEISMLSPGKVWNIERLLSWDLPSRQCWLQELPKWDGDQKRTYRTTKDVCKDAVQAVAAISGERSTTMLIPKREGSFGNKPCWHVRIGGKRKDIALESVSRKKVFYEGMIHCPTVSSGYVVFRHCGKVGISGNCNFGMSAPLMTMTYPDVFPSKAAAQREIDFYLEVCPSLKEWHNAVREQAHRMGYLQNPFGYRHYFYDVLHKRPDGSVSLGSDANRVLAFFPQSTAAAFMRANLARLGKSEWLPYLPANLSIHDALIIAPPESRIEEALEYLISLMNREIPELGGLRIGCEATLYRKNWSEGEVIRVVH